jgi:GAF domain-containing protein
MTRRTASDAFADAAAALVGDGGTADVLQALVDDCAELTEATSVGLILRTDAGELEMVAATSHQARDLEIMQLQMNDGPCLEAMQTGQPAIETTPDAIVAHWSDAGPVIVAAGYKAAHAYPMTWRGTNLGALNLFHKRPGPLTGEKTRLAQAFADMCTAAVIQGEPSDQQTNVGRARAFAARSAVEQAKGVLAQQTGRSVAEAYDLLLARAREDGATLTATAAAILSDAYKPRRGT